MMQRRGGQRPQRKDRLIREHVHDTYKSKRKLAEPAVCPQCGAVYQGGRWRWAGRPVDAHEHTCPACHRIRDKYPGGSVTLSGEFLHAHRKEILNVARNEEIREKADHPLQRIIEIAEPGDGTIVVTTTDAHLARRIGEALHRACGGDLRLEYAEEGDLLRVSWSR